jgi:DNA-directed RNA polymerase specialized sigma24 family protein
MVDPAITGVELEELISRAARRNREAIDSLLFTDWMTKLLRRVADHARQHLHVDGEEVRDHVFDQIHCQADPPKRPRPEFWLENPHDKAWADCLMVWCYTVAKNHSQNIRRHWSVEQRHVESIEHQNTQRIEHGVRIVEPSAPASSPEEELARRQQGALQCKIHETARSVFDSATEEEMKIASLWMEGKKLKQIAAALGSSIETVRRKLNKLQKTKAEELGVAEMLEDLVGGREDLEDLLVTALPEAPSYEHLPRAAA